MKKIVLNLLISVCLLNSKINCDLGNFPKTGSNSGITDNKNTAFVFAHGIGSDSKHVGWYCRGNALNWHIIGDKFYSINFHESANSKVDYTHICLTQEADMDSIGLAHKRLSLEQKTAKTVLVGVSRGASAIINYASTNPENIKALILEAPYDSIENVVKNLVKKSSLDWVPGIESISNLVKSMMNSANKNNFKRPIDMVSLIDKNIPVLFVHSKADTVVPLSSSVELAKKLKAAGHNDVYLLILSTGQHGYYQFCPSAFKYMAVVHAFYKRYGIPYDPVYATDGEIYIDGCRLQ